MNGCIFLPLHMADMIEHCHPRRGLDAQLRAYMGPTAAGSLAHHASLSHAQVRDANLSRTSVGLGSGQGHEVFARGRRSQA